MILKKKDILVQLGQYQKGQILFYNKKTKSLLAMDEKASYRSMSQLTLANSYVIGYAILAFISGLFTLQNVFLKLLLLLLCQCVMSYYAYKLQNLRMKLLFTLLILLNLTLMLLQSGLQKQGS